MATSICVSDLIQIDQMSIKIAKAQEILQMCQLQTPKSDIKWQQMFVCISFTHVLPN